MGNANSIWVKYSRKEQQWVNHQNQAFRTLIKFRQYIFASWCHSPSKMVGPFIWTNLINISISSRSPFVWFIFSLVITFWWPYDLLSTDQSETSVQREYECYWLCCIDYDKIHSLTFSCHWRRTTGYKKSSHVWAFISDEQNWHILIEIGVGKRLLLFYVLTQTTIYLPMLLIFLDSVMNC